MPIKTTDAPAKTTANEIALFVGTFSDDKQDEVWKKEKVFKTLKDGYAAFKDLCKKCVAYTYEELVEIYDVPRLDIELMQGDKIVKWMGIYERDLDEMSEPEEEEEEE